MANKKRLSQRQQQALTQQARKRQMTYLGIGGAVLAVILIAGGIFLLSPKAATSSATSASTIAGVTCSDIQTFPDEGRLHLASGETPVYRQNPPTSGSHNPNPMPAGIYTDPIDVTREVHSLEHGYIIIHYNNIHADQIQQLTNIVGGDQRKFILSPYSTMPFKISLSAWNHRQTCDGVNPQVISAFVSEFRDQGPENAP